MTCLADKIEEWREGNWYFRAKQCSDFKWHVWCSESKLIAQNALFEPLDSVVYFEFDRDKQWAIEQFRWEVGIRKKS